MRLHELFVREYGENIPRGKTGGEALTVVDDLLAQAMTRDIKSIPTGEFKSALEVRLNREVTDDDLVVLVNKSNYATSVNAEEIVPASELNPALVPDEDQENLPDVSDMARTAAKDGIEDDL